MIIVILCFSSLAIFSIAAYTSYSDLVSRADVASSSIKIFGFFMRARAIAILCFYPPDKFKMLPEPT